MKQTERSVTLFSMIGHGMLHTYEMSIPIFIVIWIDTFDATEATLGAVVGLGMASVGILAPLAGKLSDDYGSKRLVSLSIFGMGIGFLLLSPSRSLLLIAAAILVWGVSASIYHPAGLSLISRTVDDRGLALGYHGAAGSAGTAIGPFLAIALLTVFSWRIVVAVMVIPAFVAVVLGSQIHLGSDSVTSTSKREREDGITRVWESFTDARLVFTGGFVLVFLIQMAYGMYFRGLFTFLPELLSNLQTFASVELLGRRADPGQYMYSYLLVIGVLGQYVGGMCSDRYSSEALLIFSLGLLSIFTLLFLPAASYGVAALLLVSSLLAFVLFFAAPISLKLVADYADSTLHGLSYGFTYFGLWGVGSIGAVAAGVILTYGSRGILFAALAALAVVQTIIAAILSRRE